MNVDVATAIGWVQVENWRWCPPTCPNRHHSHLDGRRCGHLGYTVDDLLAWLHGRVGQVSIEIGAMASPDDQAWVLWSSDDVEVNESFAPTLLEALEAAVLAVKEASE